MTFKGTPVTFIWTVDLRVRPNLLQSERVDIDREAQVAALCPFPGSLLDEFEDLNQRHPVGKLEGKGLVERRQDGSGPGRDGVGRLSLLRLHAVSEHSQARRHDHEHAQCGREASPMSRTEPGTLCALHGRGAVSVADDAGAIEREGMPAVACPSVSVAAGRAAWVSANVASAGPPRAV